MGDPALLPSEEVESLAIEPIWLAQLRQEVAELRADVAQLRRENLELRQQSGYWRSQHAAAKLRIAELEQEVASSLARNASSRINSSAASRRRRRPIAPITWTTPTTLRSRGRAASGVTGPDPN